jgi:hypothetical protein
MILGEPPGASYPLCTASFFLTIASDILCFLQVLSVSEGFP